MINIRIELELTIDKMSEAPTPAHIIFDKLSDSNRPRIPPKEPGVAIRDEQIKRAFRWDYKSCSILYEDVSNYDNWIAQIIKVLDDVNNAVPIRKITEEVLRTFWVIPTKYDFSTLESKYRFMFIKDNPLFSNILDSTIVVESRIDLGEFHHQSGAMKINQLQTQFRVFKLKNDFPKVFLFLDATVTAKDNVEYSNQYMREYIQKAFQICKSHSDSFEKTMEAIV
ncbi:MAG: hypothetical protein Q7T57_03635 [Dehalococcoidales bacterium]|nr:hypothetical protein [Dehalococcoidales bacterium]